LVADVLKFCISLEAVKLTNFCRFLSDESAMVTAYGFPDIEFNKYSTVNSKDGSSYFFVPQVKWHLTLSSSCWIYEMCVTSVLTLYMVFNTEISTDWVRWARGGLYISSYIGMEWISLLHSWANN